MNNMLALQIASISGGNSPAGDDPMLSYVCIASIPQLSAATVQSAVGKVKSRVCRVDVHISLKWHGRKVLYLFTCTVICQYRHLHYVFVSVNHIACLVACDTFWRTNLLCYEELLKVRLCKPVHIV